MARTKVKHDSIEIQKLVTDFCVHADWIEAIFRMYVELFYFDDTIQLFDRNNRLFYKLLGDVLGRYIVLEFNKVTDPKDSGKGKEHMSVDYLVDAIEWPIEVEQKLDDLRERMNSFRKLIKPARVNMLAHLSVEAAKSKKRYGAFPEGKDGEFVKNLHEFCKIVYKASVQDNSPIHTVRIGYKPDIQHFKKTLAKSKAFDAFLLEADSQVKARLRSLIEEQFITPLRPSTWNYLQQQKQEPAAK
ncbi:MAG: hypothetical protein ABSG21_10565 [Spirochaetia bacterium]|jgi:hypothetical protein